MTLKKRSLSLLLVLCMVFGMLPFGVFAADGTETTPVYTLVTGELEAGTQYVIAQGSQAMTSEAVLTPVSGYNPTSSSRPADYPTDGTMPMLNSAAITVVDGKITSEVTSDMLWTLSAGNGNTIDGYQNFTVKSLSGKSLYRTSGYSSGYAQAPIYLADSLTGIETRYSNWMVYNMEGGNKSLFLNNATNGALNSGDYPFALNCYEGISFNTYYTGGSATEQTLADNCAKCALQFYALSDGSDPVEPPTQYTVTVETDGNGTASASAEQATAGTVITLSASASTGYRFQSWEVVEGGVRIENNKFTMPEGNVTVKALFEEKPEGDPEVLHQLLFLSDIHSGVHETDKDGLAGSQYSNLKYMLSNLKAEGLDPECVTCGGDYVRDTYADWQGNDGWQGVFDAVDGTIAENFPNAKRIYTMGNHEWESASMGSSSDKEALFLNLFGYTRSGVRIVTDDYAIYQVGAQGNQGTYRENFSSQDIKGVDDFLASMVGQQKVIFIQSHWPIHSGWNFNYRNITNAGTMLQTVNKYADDLDIVWFWGHNHYGDPMRQTVQAPGSTITYYAVQGQPSRTQSAEIKFTYVSTGCMNDMWCDHTVEGFDRDPGPGVCSYVDIHDDKLVITYSHVDYTTQASADKYNNGEMIFDHDATFYSKVPDESVTNSNPLPEAKVFYNPSTVEIPLEHTDIGAPSQYSVTVQNGRGGTASASGQMFFAGEEVTLTPVAKEGYHFKEWQVTKGDVTVVDNKFIMPESAVTVKAIFEKDETDSFTGYVLADEIEFGAQYVIVSNGYALQSVVVEDTDLAEGNTLGSADVTVEDGIITSEVTEDMVWTFEEGTSPDAPDYTGYYITSNEGKLLYRSRLGGKSAANLILSDLPVESSINRVFWIAKDLDEEGNKSLIQIGQVNNDSDYVFFLSGSAKDFNAPYSQRPDWESSYANYPVQLYKLTTTSGGSGLESIDFTNPDDASKFEIVNNTNNIAIAEGVGLTLTTTRPAFEPCNGQNTGDQATTPEEVVEIPVAGDWTATLTVDFSTGSASNGYYQFFGFYAAEGDDYGNLAGIRGGDGAMQDLLRIDGADPTAETMNSQPGFATAGTYYLQLVKEGTTYTALRSDDGETFTEMFKFEDTGIEAEKIVIDAYTGMTTGYQFTLKALDFEGGESETVCTHANKEIRNAKEATCTEAGYTGDTYCKDCGKKLSAGTAIAALGHDWDEGTVTTEPTCGKSGVKTYTCKREGCTATKTESIPATGEHTWGEWEITTPATAAVDGEQTRKCSVCGATETEAIPATGFEDVEADRYYYDAVMWAAGSGIATGTDSTHFSPDKDCTRAQAVMFLWNAAGCPEVAEDAENPFTDVKEDRYYYTAVLWAVSKGITTGTTPTTFAPYAKLDRATFVTFLWRAMGKQEAEDTGKFTDVKAGKYYAKAVAWAVSEGITAGTTDTTFAPAELCTRAQVVTFLQRAYAE